MLLLLMLLLNLLFEIFANIKWYVFNSGNTGIYNIVIGYTFTIWILLLSSMPQEFPRRVYKIAAMCFIVFYLINITAIQGLEVINNYSFLLGTLITTFFSLRLLYVNYMEEDRGQLSRFEILVIYAGLIYFTTFSVLFYTNEWNSTQLEVFHDLTFYQVISYCINTVFYGMITIAFLSLSKMKRTRLF